MTEANQPTPVEEALADDQRAANVQAQDTTADAAATPAGDEQDTSTDTASEQQ